MSLIFCAFLFLTSPINDKKIINLKNNLPSGWKMTISREKIKISSNKPIHVLFQNMINAPVSLESAEDRIKRIMKFGKKTESSLILRYEKKWSKKRVLTSQNKNSEIYKKIQKLANVPELRQIFNSRTKHTPEMLARKYGKLKEYNLYLKKKSNLEKNIVILPEFESDNYNLWLIKTTGISSESTIVHPVRISEENYRIVNLLKIYLKISSF
ncbi:hypothetical protein KKF34_16260 [Myxococcota bacterium]|nr:hypothetical protein [Myxococcota bacterium]MBU1381383.1 hypothetical protein [Myxococcota bacterium]MBU1498431.1 hypothetical protein [Myxococcota bacterium]